MISVYKSPDGKRVDLDMKQGKVWEASPGFEHLVGVPAEGIYSLLLSQGFEYIGVLNNWRDGSESFINYSKPLDWSYL